MAKITLVIGAGANKEIHPGIDLGGELITNISNRVTDRTSPHARNLSNALERDFPEYNLEVRTNFLRFLDNYIGSAKNPSIDEFLNEVETFPEFQNQRNQFLEIGLLMILAHVIGWEGSTTVDNIAKELKAEKTWLSILAKFIESNSLCIEEGNFNVITFNYDRIFEYFLLKRIPTLAQKFVKKHVHHVYGRMAKLEGLESAYDGEQSVEFGRDNSEFKEIVKLKDNIKLIRQSIDTEAIKEIIEKSGRVIFFGYGFDPINNTRIGLNRWGGKVDQNLIFNIYHGGLPDFNFSSRRNVAEKVRNIRIDADIQYLSSHDFLNYALNGIRINITAK